jgi:hypothetical protein
MSNNDTPETKLHYRIMNYLNRTIKIENCKTIYEIYNRNDPFKTFNHEPQYKDTIF